MNSFIKLLKKEGVASGDYYTLMRLEIQWLDAGEEKGEVSRPINFDTPISCVKIGTDKLPLSTY